MYIQQQTNTTTYQNINDNNKTNQTHTLKHTCKQTNNNIKQQNKQKQTNKHIDNTHNDNIIYIYYNNKTCFESKHTS